MYFSKYRTALDKSYTDKRKKDAKKLLQKFKYSGEELLMLECISKKGYCIYNKSIWTVFYRVTKRNSFIFKL